jgi:hypothetical protein
MRLKGFAVACVVLFGVALVWGGLLHLVLLRDVEAGIRSLYRPDLGDRLWLSLLLIASMVVLFVWGYSRVARVGSIREAVGYGVSFALFTGVFVDLNQYVMFPIPWRLAFIWFLGGVIEFSLYAIILSRFFQRRE